MGETITYTLRLPYAFTTPTEVTVTDPLGAGLTFASATASVGSYNGTTGVWSLGTLNGASMVTLAISATVNSGTEGETIASAPTIAYVQTHCTASAASTGVSITIQGNGGTPTSTPSYADLQVIKTANVATTTEGGTVDYTIAVTDLGPATSTGVTATDTLPSGLTFQNATASTGTYSSSTGVWTIGTLAPSSTATLDIAATVNSGTASSTITNTAIATESTSTIDNNLSNNSSSVSVFVEATSTGGCGSSCPAYADISVQKTVDVTSTTEGATVHYAIKVKDLGPATSTGVVATDTLPSGVTFLSASASTGTYSTSTGAWTIGTVAPSSTATLDIAAEVNSGTAGSTITNTATVTESTSTIDNNLSNNSSSASFRVASNGGGCTCSVAGAFTDGVSDLTPKTGETITYTLTGAPALTAPTHIVVTDALGAGLTFVSASTSVGTYSSSTGTWDLGTLNGASTVTLTITATVNAGTEGQTIQNDPSVEYVQTGCTQSSAVTGVPITVQSSTAPVADIAVTKTVDNANPSEGNTVNYTITATDNGPATSTDVVATDTLPSGLTFENATASEGSYSSSTGIWTIGTVAPDATATLQIAALVNSGTAGNMITNTVTIGESSTETDSDLANNTASATLTVAGGGGGCGSSCPVYADVSVQKTADVTSTVEGGTIDYTITATDLGPATSTDVVATDTLPSGLTFVNATASVGTYSTSTGAWTIGTLTANATATLQIAATANAGTGGTTITNTAVIGESSTETDTNPGNNSSSVSVYIEPNTGCGSSCPVADIAIEKTVDDATPYPGDTVNYLLTVTDNGPATSTFVVAQDQLPPSTALSFLAATTSQGTYNLTTGDWDIGTVAPNATATLQLAAVVGMNEAGQTITNTATVSELASIIDPNPGNNSSTATINVQTPGGGCGSSCPTNPQADISVNKTVDNANPSEGDTVNYTITASDIGTATSTGVVATDTLPAGVTFVSATTSEGSYASSTGIWTIGDIAMNATATLQIAATVNSGTAGTAITNTATIGETATDTDASDKTSSATINVQSNGGGCTSNCGGGGSTPTAEIGIVKTVDNANPYPGTTIHYTLTVSATGPSPSISVVASDTLPADITFVSASSSLGTYNSATGQWAIGDMADGHVIDSSSRVGIPCRGRAGERLSACRGSRRTGEILAHFCWGPHRRGRHTYRYKARPRAGIAGRYGCAADPGRRHPGAPPRSGRFCVPASRDHACLRP